MNGVGRQGQRSVAVEVHHQCQHLDNFLVSSSNGHWLQSTSLQHLYSSSSSSINPSLPPLQDYGFYGGGGGGGQGSRMYRNAQRGFNGGNEFLLEPSTPPGLGNSQSRKNNGGGKDLPGGDFSPGLLDLHSFDIELLLEVWGLLTFPQSAF